MNRNCLLFTALTALAVLVVAGPATAGIIQDLANATIVEEFLFDDASGTAIPAAANNVTSHLWDDDADNVDVKTNGLGQLNASLKDNNEFGSNYVDSRNFTSGRIFGVMEMTWDFQSTLDTAENEELRISLIQFNPRSTFVTAEWEIQREDDDTLTILGNGVGTGSSDLAAVVLNGGSLTQSTKFIAVVEANLNNSTYQVHYSSDGGTSFTTMGTGALDPSRDIASMRMTLNNNLLGDNVLIDRVYMARIPEPASGVLMALGLALAAAFRRRHR